MKCILNRRKVVVIGGGNGSAISICALKQHADIFDISAVVSMSDSGGSSGRLREEFNTLPPSDIMRVVLSMSKYDYHLLRNVFYGSRFKRVGKLSKHNLGNLFLILAERYCGDYMRAVRALEQAIEAIGRVYPATLDKTDLIVELSSGKIVRTEGKIDRPDYDRQLRIKKAWLEPAGRIYVGARQAIKNADYIIMGPGSLYCSIIAALLPQGVKEAIARSKAKLVYVAGDAYELHGETGPVQLSDYVKELQLYLPRQLDMVVYNNSIQTASQRKKYQEKKWARIKMDAENLPGHNAFGADYEHAEGRLDPLKLGKILKRIIFSQTYGTKKRDKKCPSH